MIKYFSFKDYKHIFSNFVFYVFNIERLMQGIKNMFIIAEKFKKRKKKNNKNKNPKKLKILKNQTKISKYSKIF